MLMDKEQFLKKMGKLHDICKEFHMDITIKGGARPQPQGTVMMLADRLAEMRDARTIPFDIPVVSAQMIQLVPEFRTQSKRAIAGALRTIGCNFVGKDFETPTGKTTLWCCWGEEWLAKQSKKRLCAVYNREEQWPTEDYKE